MNELVFEQDLHNAVLNAPIGICIMDAATLVSEIVNDSFIEVAGRPYDAIVGKFYWDTFAEARQYYESALNSVVENGIAFHANEVELMLIRHGKEEQVFVTFVYSPVKDKSGKVKKVAVWVLENTTQVMARQKIKESEERFRTMAEGTQILIATSDETSNATYFNKAWENFTGRPVEDLLNFGWVDLIHEEDRQGFVDMYLNSFSKREPWKGEFRILNKEGKYRWLLSMGPPRFRPDSTFAGYISSSIDITERKQAEKELEFKNQQLLRVNNDLDNFIYTASHDLKAPISNIEGLVNVLSNSFNEGIDDKEDVKRVLSLINSSIHRFKNTIEALTEVSKVQRDLEEDISEINLHNVIEGIKILIKENIEESKAQIVIENPLPVIKFSNKNIQSIMYNLMSNAIKYKSSARNPIISIRSKQLEDQVLLEVEDNGIGIPPNQIYNIFKMFKRAHQHVEGSGVGLYLVKRIIDNAGGKIEVESKIDQGSIFRLYFKK